MTIKVTIQCDTCPDGSEKEMIELWGRRKERHTIFDEQGWEAVESTERYMGPKCLAIALLVEKTKVGTIIVSSEVEKKKPSMEFIDDDSFAMAYPSRFCDLGYGTNMGAYNHEVKYHRDAFMANRVTARDIRDSKQMKKRYIVSRGQNKKLRHCMNFAKAKGSNT